MTALLLIALTCPAGAEPAGKELDSILTSVEKRYETARGFSANFTQESTLKAIGITDYARGSAVFSRPAKMRWEYESPERQEIITDGTKLWIYRPDENQVMLGGAPAYFGDGKGASFLTDVSLIRKNFKVTLEPKGKNDIFRLKLVPLIESPDLSEIFLSVAPKTFEVIEITTYNAYGDETRIMFHDLRFLKNPKDALFTFKIPEGTDVLYLEEGNK